MKRKGNWMKHIMRGKGILMTFHDGSVERKKRRDKKRLIMTNDIKKYTKELRNIPIEGSIAYGACQLPEHQMT